MSENSSSFDNPFIVLTRRRLTDPMDFVGYYSSEEKAIKAAEVSARLTLQETCVLEAKHFFRVAVEHGEVKIDEDN